MIGFAPGSKGVHLYSMLQCGRDVLKREGVLGFWKGSSAAVLKSGLTTMCIFFMYERVLCCLESGAEAE